MADFCDWGQGRNNLDPPSGIVADLEGAVQQTLLRQIPERIDDGADLRPVPAAV